MHRRVQVLSFDDCIEKVESVGNTLRVQAALEMIREQEQEVGMCVGGIGLWGQFAWVSDYLHACTVYSYLHACSVYSRVPV